VCLSRSATVVPVGFEGVGLDDSEERQMRATSGPRLVHQELCDLGNGRIVEVFGYDAVIGIGEDGRATRWDSIVRDASGKIVDSGAVSESMARAMIDAARRRLDIGVVS